MADTNLESAVARRGYWVDEIVRISGRFGDDSRRVEGVLDQEVKSDGCVAIVDHLRFCGAIPERYEHDSSEEKLYSKYTDAVLAVAFRHIGLTALVLGERADAADVEATSDDLSFVADAKAFRLSRTAKNQKDFKVEAMHHWKRGKPHAIVVCPIYQLPTRQSQIYQQAINRAVCVFSFSHLSVLVRYADKKNGQAAQKLLRAVLESSEPMNPTKDAVAYWTNLNRTMLDYDAVIADIWREEKAATTDALAIAKEEALVHCAAERERIMKMGREEAVRELVVAHKLDRRKGKIMTVTNNNILAIA